MSDSIKTVSKKQVMSDYDAKTDTVRVTNFYVLNDQGETLHGKSAQRLPVAALTREQLIEATTWHVMSYERPSIVCRPDNQLRALLRRQYR